MTAIRCVLAALSLAALVGGCVIREEPGGERFERDRGEYRHEGRNLDQAHGAERGAQHEQEREGQTFDRRPD